MKSDLKPIALLVALATLFVPWPMLATIAALIALLVLIVQKGTLKLDVDTNSTQNAKEVGYDFYSSE